MNRRAFISAILVTAASPALRVMSDKRGLTENNVNINAGAVPGDWNKTYQDGRLIQASPPNEFMRGVSFHDCSLSVIPGEDGPEQVRMPGIES